MKKVVSIMVVLVMICALLAGCGQTSTGESAASESSAAATKAVESAADTQESAAASEAAGAPQGIKIGVSGWDNTSALGLEVDEYLQMAANALGCEYTFLVDGFDPDTQIANIENLIASGCQAVFLCNSSEAILPKLISICEENKVYLGLYMRQIVDEDVRKMAEESQYFIGVTHEDEENVGYLLGCALADKGATQVGFITWNRGDATNEARYAGYKRAFEEKGVTILAEEWEVTTAEAAASATERFIAAYPEMDGLVCCGGGGEPLEGTMTTLKNHDLTGKIPLVSSDFGPNIAEQLKNGEIAAMTGGHSVDALYEFMLLYNYATGNPLSDEGYIEIKDTPIVLTSYDDAVAYDKWCKSDIKAYTEDEIRDMAVAFNPDFTLDELKSIAEAYSVDDVAQRHADLVK
ncbi:MAG: substrate-binding domain-containing protein [Christensenella sp.]|nr:substrate-binding domain-containing protein [Christensenella sp.]